MPEALDEVDQGRTDSDDHHGDGQGHYNPSYGPEGAPVGIFLFRDGNCGLGGQRLPGDALANSYHVVWVLLLGVWLWLVGMCREPLPAQRWQREASSGCVQPDGSGSDGDGDQGDADDLEDAPAGTGLGHGHALGLVFVDFLGALGGAHHGLVDLLLVLFQG